MIAYCIHKSEHSLLHTPQTGLTDLLSIFNTAYVHIHVYTFVTYFPIDIASDIEEIVGISHRPKGHTETMSQRREYRVEMEHVNYSENGMVEYVRQAAYNPQDAVIAAEELMGKDWRTVAVYIQVTEY